MTLFLTLDEILALHARMVERFGGSPGIRDLGLLESALAMPEASYEGVLLHATLFEQAAAYLFHLARNHPFVDGNKRAALAAALVFLGMNGRFLDAAGDVEVYALVDGIAQGKRSKADAAVFFQRFATAG